MAEENGADPARLVATAIGTVLRSVRIRWANERELQDGIFKALDKYLSSAEVEREVVLTPRDRIDFRCGRVGIEVKIGGSAESVMRQLTRYAPHVDELILVTTRHTHATLPASISGKRLTVVKIGRVIA